jgi:hypothetical protein
MIRFWERDDLPAFGAEAEVVFGEFPDDDFCAREELWAADNLLTRERGCGGGYHRAFAGEV